MTKINLRNIKFGDTYVLRCGARIVAKNVSPKNYIVTIDGLQWHLDGTVLISRDRILSPLDIIEVIPKKITSADLKVGDVFYIENDGCYNKIFFKLVIKHNFIDFNWLGCEWYADHEAKGMTIIRIADNQNIIMADERAITPCK